MLAVIVDRYDPLHSNIEKDVTGIRGKPVKAVMVLVVTGTSQPSSFSVHCSHCRTPLQTPLHTDRPGCITTSSGSRRKSSSSAFCCTPCCSVEDSTSGSVGSSTITRSQSNEWRGEKKNNNTATDRNIVSTFSFINGLGDSHRPKVGYTRYKVGSQ